MFADAPSLRKPTQPLRILCGILYLCVQVSLWAAETVVHRFDIPASDAVVSLQLFATQSGRQVLYSGDAVAGTQTVAVR